MTTLKERTVIDRPPTRQRPPRRPLPPRTLSREFNEHRPLWILVGLTAVLVTVVAILVMRTTPVETYDRAAEHGEATPLVIDQRTELTTQFVGDDAAFDPDVAFEHGAFTPFVPDLREDLEPTFVGADANLDPDVPFEHGAFTSFVPDLRTTTDPLFIGQDADLDSDS